MMKRVLIALLISIFFILLLAFISYTYSPFDQSGLENIINRYGITEEDEFREVVSRSVELGIAWEFIHLPNLIAWLVALAGACVSLFASVHMFIDKLFTKKFFEQPELVPAIRRGIFVFLVLFILITLQLLGALVWYTVAISILLLIFCEVIIVYWQDAGRRIRTD